MIDLMSVEHVSTTTLIEEAEREIQHYRSRQVRGTNNAAFELFRRAFVLRDEQAWSGIYLLYANLVASWILHQMGSIQLSHDDHASLINIAFGKFSHSISAQKFTQFSSVERLIAYFKSCTRSVVVDELRLRQLHHHYEQTMDDIEEEPATEDPADMILGKLVASEVWRIVQSVVGEEERIILLHNCILGYPPREIQRRFPALFAEVEDIHRMRRNVIERLKRSRRFRAALQAEGVIL